MPKVIKVAPREMRRLVNSAVGKSFLKTITELVTNADSALKDKAGVAHAAGIIEQMLDVPKGQQLDTSTLKASLPKQKEREIRVRLWTTGTKARQIEVIDAGPGMTRDELEDKFGTYAEAKAKGKRTRSLFGRGALDVLLAHEESTIYSVKNGRLAACKVYWDNDPVVDAIDHGPATDALLRRHDLPKNILGGGTVVRFRIKASNAPIPNEDRIIANASRFYMLRLIAADPNTNFIIERHRTGVDVEEAAAFDFPIGTVIGRFKDTFSAAGARLPVEILVARSNEPLQTDPLNIERRENGLLFVDDNDAVLDLTLLPEYDKEPALRHLFGVVRITGFRDVLEQRLEDESPEAVLSETRDGFNRRSEIAQALFSLVERHVKPLYEKEIQRQRKGNTTRSEKLNEKVKNVLKLLNHFNNEETDDPGDDPEPPKQQDPIYFSTKVVTLHAGTTRHVSVFVNPDHVPNGEIVLFESDNPEITVEPDSEVVTHRKNKHQRIELTVHCGIKGERGSLMATTLDKKGKEVRATLRVTNVIDPPVFQPPANIEFASSSYPGQPGRRNRAVLIVNLAAFTGMPEITFSLQAKVGAVSLPGSEDHIKIKVRDEHVVDGKRIARVPILFDGTAWGQHADLIARVKVADGTVVFAKCHLRFERPEGSQKFNDFRYVEFDRPVLGEVAGDKLYINASYPVHQQLFGATEAEFNSRLETDGFAQLRAASVLVETAVYHAATVTYRAGGKKGWELDGDDPVGSFRQYFEARRMRLEPQVIRAMCTELVEATSRAENAAVSA